MEQSRENSVPLSEGGNTPCCFPRPHWVQVKLKALLLLLEAFNNRGLPRGLPAPGWGRWAAEAAGQPRPGHRGVAQAARSWGLPRVDVVKVIINIKPGKYPETLCGEQARHSGRRRDPPCPAPEPDPYRARHAPARWPPLPSAPRPLPAPAPEQTPPLPSASASPPAPGTGARTFPWRQHAAGGPANPEVVRGAGEAAHAHGAARRQWRRRRRPAGGVTSSSGQRSVAAELKGGWDRNVWARWGLLGVSPPARWLPGRPGAQWGLSPSAQAAARLRRRKSAAAPQGLGGAGAEEICLDCVQGWAERTCGFHRSVPHRSGPGCPCVPLR